MSEDRASVYENVPFHYDYAIQPITYITKNNLNWWEGNIIKYASRARRKGQEESDLEKVIHYAQLRLEAVRLAKADLINLTRTDMDSFDPKECQHESWTKQHHWDQCNDCHMFRYHTNPEAWR